MLLAIHIPFGAVLLVYISFVSTFISLQEHIWYKVDAYMTNDGELH